MKYFESIMELDNVATQIACKLEIGKSQMDIIYDKLVADAEASYTICKSLCRQNRKRG